jgi:hypothetical protein
MTFLCFLHSTCVCHITFLTALYSSCINPNPYLVLNAGMTLVVHLGSPAGAPKLPPQSKGIYGGQLTVERVSVYTRGDIDDDDQDSSCHGRHGPLGQAGH